VLKNKKFLAIALLSSFVSAFIPALSNAQTLDSEHKYWSVFTMKQQGKKVCYITSTPKTEAGNYTRRGEPYILVTYRGNGVSEVSTSSGYPYKPGSDVKVTIDKKNKVSLFTSNDTPKIAWANSAKDDAKLVKLMKKGNSILVHATSKKNTYSKDTYSLFGFSKAYNRMKAACK